MMPQTLGIDFGTSNSAAGLMAGPTAFLIEVEPGQTTLPTSVFFDTSRKLTSYGSIANAALIDGREGRFMRALKSVLGTPLMHEQRQIAYERTTLLTVVAHFLQMIKERAEAATGLTLPHAISGRPVRFHSSDDARNAKALEDLREAYLLAGFESVDFLFEPEAAALSVSDLAPDTLGLIVDIGGGTSDFSVFRRDGDATDIIVSHGVRVGGTDFDKAISLSHVMPLLGRGHQIRADMGDAQYTAPNGIYTDLASWEKIPFQYTPENRKMAQIFAKRGLEPARFERLHNVLDLELGHDIAFSVEAGKIAANAPGVQDAQIDLSILDTTLTAPLTTQALRACLAPSVGAIRQCAEETLQRANLRADQIDTVVFVGGSSLVQAVRDAMRDLFLSATLVDSQAFTAVVTGLAIAAARADAQR